MDCWNLILEQLNVKELLNTESTCKDWQRLVFEHLACRSITIFDIHEMTGYNTLILRRTREAWVAFKLWLRKCGHLVHYFDVDCQHIKYVVEALRDYCPNMKFLTLRRLKKLSTTNQLHFNKLNKLEFEYCDELTDDCVSQFLTSSLEELSIIYNKRVTGRFLNNLKPDNNVWYLKLKHCRAFKLPVLLSNTDRLTNLSALKLYKRNRSKIEIRNQLHLVLDRLPNLQDICFEVYDLLSDADSLAESNVFFESVCRLENLDSLKANFQVWDHHLEEIARSCKEITVIRLMCNGMTKSGLDALCRHAGPRLSELNLSGAPITTDDVVACVYACPGLLHLELCDCPMLDYSSVKQRIAAARRDMLKSVPETEHYHSLRFQLELILYKHNDNTGDGY